MTWLWCGDTWLLAGCNTEMLCRTTPSHLVTGITTTSHSQPPTASISHQFLMSLKKPKLYSNISLDCGRLTRPEQTRKVAVERCGTTDSRSTCSQDLCEPWHWPGCCLPLACTHSQAAVLGHSIPTDQHSQDWLYCSLSAHCCSVDIKYFTTKTLAPGLLLIQATASISQHCFVQIIKYSQTFVTFDTRRLVSAC